MFERQILHASGLEGGRAQNLELKSHKKRKDVTLKHHNQTVFIWIGMRADNSSTSDIYRHVVCLILNLPHQEFKETINVLQMEDKKIKTPFLQRVVITVGICGTNYRSTTKIG